MVTTLPDSGNDSGNASCEVTYRQSKFSFGIVYSFLVNKNAEEFVILRLTEGVRISKAKVRISERKTKFI